MSKFPSSVPLPQSVYESRKQRRQQMIRAAKRGVLLRSSIILAEIVGFVYLNSSALLLDAIHSLIDVSFSLFLILCISLADKPPDRNHPFGHGRFEPVAGLQLGMFLAVIGAGMFFQQISAIFQSTTGKEIQPYTWVIPFCAVFLLEISYQLLKRCAKRENSPALLADAIHYRIDSLNSLFATIALAFAAYFPKHGVLFDHLGAIAIALLMVGIGAFAARNNLHQLLDRSPEGAFFEKVREAAMRVQGVLATEKLKIQIFGPDAHVSIDIEVAPNLSVEIAHRLTQDVRAEIQKAWPAVRDVIVHVEPFFPGDHPLS